MTLRDMEKVKRLKATFDSNFKLTRLYASYLENCPDIITGEIIDELCSDGALTKEDAIAGMLGEIFALNTDKSEDRHFIRDYIRPSIRILDSRKYIENKYYKNIKIDEVRDGAWEFKLESYEPYRAVICDDMIINEDFSEIPPLGFFTEKFSFPAVLEGGNEWMTLTPVDLDTCEGAIEEAQGKVVTFGLGLGYYAYMASEKEEVESVTVIEKSENVIRLFKKHILPQFSHKEKVRIICADAFEYAEKVMPSESFDYAFVDTWRDASDGTPMYVRMKKLEHLSAKTSFSYWIERFLISRIRATNFMKLYELYLMDTKDAPKSYEEFTERLEEI